MSKETQQIIITTIFVVVLVLLVNPFHFYMPTKVLYVTLGSLLVLFGVFMSFVLSEKPLDEREQLHQHLSHKSAYLWGSAALVVGIIYQGITEKYIDEWLIIVLGVMVISKVLSRFHSTRHK